MDYPIHVQDLEDSDAVGQEAAPKARPVRSRRPMPQVAGPSGIGTLSTTTMIFSAIVGLMEWFFSFALGWIPGVSWLISFGFTAVQTIIIYLDPNSQHLPFYERSKLFLKREGVLFAAGALSGIPIIGEVIPFEAIAAFVLRFLKVPTKPTTT
ncbi:MAG TPA: hypothetical protein VN420_01970 [Candidatus Fimivivens sp.]|nr:hypothetical protein [Candidatus Fimivivens sp.]